MNLEDILLEWSYRCPKGYPTIVDGKFVDRDEVVLLNELLAQRGLGTVQLPSPKKVFEAKPQMDPAVVDKVHSDIIALPGMKQQISSAASSITKIKSTPKFSEWRVELPGKDERYQKTTAVSKELTSAVLTKKFKKPTQLSVQNGKMLVFNVDGYQYRYTLKPVKKESSTSTDVKEGMSVLFSQHNESVTDPTKVISFVTADTVAEACLQLISYVKKNKIKGLSDDTVNQCVEFMELVVRAKNPKTIKDATQILNQNISHASTFNDFFIENSDFIIERDKLFNEIRSAGSTITGYPADKWCPGDIYFVKEKDIQTISSTVKEAKTLAATNKEQALGMINGLFSDKYYDVADAPIVAVSLKMQDAQAGKLKSGFEEYADTPTEYSLTSDELSYKASDYRQGCLRYQKLFASELKKADVDIVWDFCDVNKLKDIQVLKFKYAAYKALHFILTKIAGNKMANFDDAMVSMVAYGLGVIGKAKGFKSTTRINPPFFKAIASKSAQATKPVLFKGGSVLALINTDGTTKNPKITIIDRPTYKGVQVTMGLLVGSDKFDISIRINSNGNTQVNVELEKAEHFS